jgi:antirestriction protein ArdC
MKSDRGDPYEHVTNKVIADLEQGVPPWKRPWSGNDAATAPPFR